MNTLIVSLVCVMCMCNLEMLKLVTSDRWIIDLKPWILTWDLENGIWNMG